MCIRDRLNSLTLDSVTSFDVLGNPIDRTSEFVLTTPGVGFYNIETTAFFYYDTEAAVNQTENYEFVFTAVPTNPALNTTVITRPGGLSNIAPQLTANNSSGAAGTIVAEISSDSNGANDSDGRRYSELVFDITSQLDVSSSNPVNYFSLQNPFFVTGGGGTFFKARVEAAPNTPIGVYTVTYRVRDCSGNGLSTSTQTSITVTPAVMSGIPKTSTDFTLWEGGTMYYGTCLLYTSPSPRDS